MNVFIVAAASKQLQLPIITIEEIVDALVLYLANIANYVHARAGITCDPTLKTTTIELHGQVERKLDCDICIRAMIDGKAAPELSTRLWADQFVVHVDSEDLDLKLDLAVHPNPDKSIAISKLNRLELEQVRLDGEFVRGEDVLAGREDEQIADDGEAVSREHEPAAVKAEDPAREEGPVVAGVQQVGGEIEPIAAEGRPAGRESERVDTETALINDADVPVEVDERAEIKPDAEEQVQSEGGPAVIAAMQAGGGQGLIPNAEKPAGQDHEPIAFENAQLGVDEGSGEIGSDAEERVQSEGEPAVIAAMQAGGGQGLIPSAEKPASQDDEPIVFEDAQLPPAALCHDEETILVVDEQLRPAEVCRDGEPVPLEDILVGLEDGPLILEIEEISLEQAVIDRDAKPVPGEDKQSAAGEAPVGVEEKQATADAAPVIGEEKTADGDLPVPPERRDDVVVQLEPEQAGHDERKQIDLGAASVFEDEKTRRNETAGLEEKQMRCAEDQAIFSGGQKTRCAIVKGNGAFELSISGESNYQQELEQIAGTRATAGIRRLVAALLVPDPDNFFDKNAVAVQIERRTVGYLSFEMAPIFSKALTDGGFTSAASGAAIVGAGRQSESENGYFIVMLDAAVPFVLIDRMQHAGMTEVRDKTSAAA